VMNSTESRSSSTECFWLLRRSRLFDLLIIVVVMTALGRADAQTAPNVEETVGVNINIADFSPFLQTGKTFFINTGIDWVRSDTIWQNVETTPGCQVNPLICQTPFQSRSKCGRCGNPPTQPCYDYSQLDTLVDTLPSGVRPYFILDYSNTVYEPSCLTGKCVTSQNTINGFAAFAENIMTPQSQGGGYGGKKYVWEIWNEPNDLKFWPPPPTPPGNLLYYTLASCTSNVLAGNTATANEYLAGPAYASVTNVNGTLSSCGGSYPQADQSVDLGSDSLSLPFLLGSPSVLQYWSGLSVHFYRGLAPE